MKTYSVLILGYGVVGKNIYKELQVSPQIELSIYDKYKNFGSNIKPRYDLAFVCVDTPMTKDSVCDISEVQSAIMENDADIYVIKSTVLPGTTEVLKHTLQKRLVFSPEYYGDTQHCNNFDFNFTILGGDKIDCIIVQQILQRVYDSTHQFRITTSRTAELVKYMENAYLATKVSFCNQFYDLAENLGVCYEDLRELFILDPRVNPSHTFVYRDHPYWDSHCLNKDLPAIAEGCNAEFIKFIIEYNNKRKP